MSFLREQLDVAHRQYRAVVYPGNLAMEVLAPRWRWRQLLMLGASGAGAIAAAAVMAAVMFRPILLPTSHRPPLSVQNIPLVPEVRLALHSLPVIKDLPPRHTLDVRSIFAHPIDRLNT